MVQYKVVGECATFTTDTPTGRMRMTYFKGALVPAAATEREIIHHLSVGLIQPVGVPAQSRAAQPPAPAPESRGPAPAVSGGGEADLPEERQKARAKLPPDGSLPHHNAAKPVWVEAAVARGYAYEAANAVDKAELMALLKG